MREGELVGGRYRLQERVGAGGMGVVWRAADEHQPRVVALKRTETGQEFATGLRHPNVVAQYESVTEHGDRWLVMEYVPSRNLAEVLREDGPLPPRDAARIGARLAGALAAVHRAGVVHRDVTPGNVLIAEDGAIKLTDFGISRPLWNEVTMTQGSLVPGTPGYLAPEVANGADPTRASDLFSLGALLFRAVEGRSAFGDAEHPLVLLRRSAAGEVGKPERAGALTPVLNALLAVAPAARPDAPRTEALLEWCRRVPTRRPFARRRGAAVATGGSRSPARPWSRRWRPYWWSSCPSTRRRPLPRRRSSRVRRICARCWPHLRWSSSARSSRSRIAVSSASAGCWSGPPPARAWT
ncbi:serine/threonine-protein kinase [Amycolatopsis lurida]